MAANIASRALFGGFTSLGYPGMRLFLFGWGLIAVGLVVATLALDTRTQSQAGSAPQVVADSFSQLPLSFEANEGQTDDRVEFLSRGQGYTLFLTPTGAVLSLKVPTTTASDGAEDAADSAATTALRMHLLG